MPFVIVTICNFGEVMWFLYLFYLGPGNIFMPVSNNFLHLRLQVINLPSFLCTLNHCRDIQMGFSFHCGAEFHNYLYQTYVFTFLLYPFIYMSSSLEKYLNKGLANFLLCSYIST